MQAVNATQDSALSAVQLKRTTRHELRRLIDESGIVIARERLRLLDVVGQGLVLLMCFAVELLKPQNSTFSIFGGLLYDCCGFVVLRGIGRGG